MEEMFDELVKYLSEKVPDLGRDLAGDATHLRAKRGRGVENGKGLQPDGGRKEYVNFRGEVERVFEWYGYKLHIICDSRHEVALGYKVTAASVADNKVFPEVVRGVVKKLPLKRVETVAYDKAADDEDVHRELMDLGVKPVIQNRSMWRDGEERVLENSLSKNVVYDEAGTVYCYDMVSKPAVKHCMAYLGYEKSRGTIKYRCPARQEGWACAGEKRCNKGKRYGLTVRIKCGLDLRRFPPIPRATKTFERLYKGRSAVERVNARLKIYWGVDDGNVAGGYNFFGKVGLVIPIKIGIGLATLLANSTRHEIGHLGVMRLRPIVNRLAGK